MHNIIYPLKDATLYSKYPEVNTGLDEILEIRKEISSSVYTYRGSWKSGSFYRRYDYVIGGSGEYYYALAENINQTISSAYWEQLSTADAWIENSRILIKFDLNNFIAQATASASLVYLNLYTCIARKVPTEYTLIAHPITGSWEMGIGNFTEKLVTTGVSWERRDSESDWNTNGGEYFASYSSSQNFNFVPTDIRMNVTNIFNEWISGTFANEGFIVKRTDAQEDNGVSYGSLSFYSMDTHTVYVPTLEILYDDYSYSTGSFYPFVTASNAVTGSLISGSISISMKYFRPEYKYNEVARFKINVKPSYVTKTFYENLRLNDIYYLSPNSLYYSIVDAYSNRVMVPFSDYTKVSLGADGYYFDASLSGFMPERFYKILFKYVGEAGEIQYFDVRSQFKVVK